MLYANLFEINMKRFHGLVEFVENYFNNVLSSALPSGK